jgi:hypothetical protein
MELLYLYIPESAGYILKDANINFSGRHRFHYDKITGELKYEENLHAIDGSFFTTEKYKSSNVVVSSVSAIVGDNGAGKTTIADFLHKIQFDSTEHIIVWKNAKGEFEWSAFIIPETLSNEKIGEFQNFLDNNNQHSTDVEVNLKTVYNEKNGQYIINRKAISYRDFRHQLNWVLSMSFSLPNFLFPDINNNLKSCLIKKKHKKRDDLNYTLIYSSNFYTPLHDIGSTNNTIDISTSEYLKQDKETKDNDTITGDPISAHFHMEMIRNAELILKFNNSENLEWKIPTPKGVLISVSNSDIIVFRNDHEESIKDAIRLDIKQKDRDEVKLHEVVILLKKELETESPKYTSLLENLIYKAIEPLPQKSLGGLSFNEFKISLFKAFLANFFRYNIKMKEGTGNEISVQNDSDKKEAFTKVLRNFLESDQDIESVLTCCEELAKVETLKTIAIGNYETTYKKLIEPNKFFSFIKKLKSGNMTSDGYYIDLGKASELKHFKDLLIDYFAAQTITHFISFRWSPRVSAGELAQLNIYSRLFSVLKKNGVNYSNLKNDIVIFFDEIEITVHPRLQRRLVSNLIEFFNKFFKECKFKVHLIFASHSPILLSDIPKDQTVLLRRSGRSVSAIKDQTETFSANIHSLYEHHFRLGDKEESLIGQFAFEKIRELVKRIENLDPNKIDSKVVEGIECEISVIGEPFMQHKIIELLKENMPDIDKRRYQKQRLDQLEKEAEKIRKELDGDGNA